MFWNANVLECECFGMRMVSAGCRRCRRCGRVLPGGQVPGMGELAGGSAREERIDVLEARMAELGVHDIQWYSDLRRFGTVPHAGFGLGFERLMLYLTGLSNVRDVIPVPRHPSWCKF